MIFNDGVTYIASPYTHKNKRVRSQRYYDVMDATAYFIKRNEVVYSPIVHSHPLAIAHDMPGDFEMWRKQCLGLLEKCDRVRVICLSGWEKSAGVRGELEHANNLGIPVFYCRPISPFEIFQTN